MTAMFKPPFHNFRAPLGYQPADLGDFAGPEPAVECHGEIVQPKLTFMTGLEDMNMHPFGQVVAIVGFGTIGFAGGAAGAGEGFEVPGDQLPGAGDAGRFPATRIGVARIGHLGKVLRPAAQHLPGGLEMGGADDRRLKVRLARAGAVQVNPQGAQLTQAAIEADRPSSRCRPG